MLRLALVRALAPQGQQPRGFDLLAARDEVAAAGLLEAVETRVRGELVPWAPGEGGGDRARSQAE